MSHSQGSQPVGASPSARQTPNMDQLKRESLVDFGGLDKMYREGQVHVVRRWSGQDSAPPSVSIIIPAFNESRRLPISVPRLLSVIDLETTEVIVVDDGSRDGTGGVAADLLNDLRHGAVLRLNENAGKGAAVRAGVAHARGTSTVFMDADLATDPGDIFGLLDGLDRADVVIGSRAAPGASVENAPWMRAVMGWTFNRFLRSVTGLELRDTQCGFKAFRTPLAKLLFSRSRIDGFAIDVEILLLARRIGLVVEEVPVRWRHQPGSQVSPVRDSLAMVSDVVRLRRGGWSKAIPSIAVQVHGDGEPARPAIGVAFDSVAAIEG